MPVETLIEQLASDLRTGFAALEKRLDAMDATLNTQGATVQDVVARLSRLETRQDAVEDRQEGSNMRYQKMSEIDTRHETSITALALDVTSLKATQETQLSILRRLDAVAANPMIRKIAYAIGGAVLAYLAGKGWLTQ